MDIYVNPTLDEGFGIAVVEAMLASLPVVLADKERDYCPVGDGYQIAFAGRDEFFPQFS